MATSVVARETLFSLRRQIAKIEGRLPEQLRADDGDSTVLRHSGVPGKEWLATGIDSLDALLGGGVPLAALTEIHGSVMHGAGAAAGFALALIALIGAKEPSGAEDGTAVLWISVQDALAEAGTPYAPGLIQHAGVMPCDLLISRTATVEDALWIAEEASGLRQLRALVVEVHGNPLRLDLTATRRLHRRARKASRPVFLIRQSAALWPTAAALRLLVAPSPATPRSILTGPLDGTIGRPAFTVTVSKSRAGKPVQLILEWNPHDRAFEERPTQDPRSLVPVPAFRPHLPPTTGAIVAFSADTRPPAPRLQPTGEQHPAHRRAQRAG